MRDPMPSPNRRVIISSMGQMNGLDYVIVAAIALGAIYGLSRGALRMATSVLSVAIGLYVASIKYGWAAAFARKQFGTNPTLSAVIGYVVMFAIVFVAVEIAGRTVTRLARIVHLAWLDRIGGGILGAAIAAALAGVGVMLLTAALPADTPFLTHSDLAHELVAYNYALLEYVPPEVRTAYESKTKVLLREWVKQAQKGLERHATDTPTTQASPAPR
jgi:membrane protein required for colicin V production